MKAIKQFFKGFKKGMSGFSTSISIIVNTILLTFVYIVGVGATSVIAKVFKKHFLSKRRLKTTYWSDLDLKKKPIEEYYRQF